MKKQKRDIYISFIIPAYNAEKTINRCIKSILDGISDNLQLQHIEVIIVENGSNDETSSIVESLALQFSQVKLIHSGKGVSIARNAGLDVAIGDYIAFVDADDYLDSDGLQLFYRDIKDKTVDLFLYGHFSGKEIRKITDKNAPELYTGKKIEFCRVKMLENPTKYMQVWAKLFKKSIIVENDIRFNERLHLAEDSDFTLRYTKFCKKIIFLPQNIYHYTLNPTSTMRIYDGNKIKRYIVSMEQTALMMIYESKNLQYAFQKYILIHMNIAMVREIFVKSNTDSYINKYNKMSKLSKESIFREAILRVSINECFKLRFLPIFFFKIHLSMVSSFLYFIRAEQNARKEK